MNDGKANLVPFKPGEDERRNMNGRPKGRKNLATIVRELEDEQFDWSVIPGIAEEVQKLLGGMGSPWRAIVMRAAMDAAKGNIKAAEFLRKSGYGDKLDVTSNGETIAPKIVSTIVPKHAEPQPETSDSNSSDQ